MRWLSDERDIEEAQGRPAAVSQSREDGVFLIELNPNVRPALLVKALEAAEDKMDDPDTLGSWQADGDQAWRGRWVSA